MCFAKILTLTICRIPALGIDFLRRKESSSLEGVFRGLHRSCHLNGGVK